MPGWADVGAAAREISQIRLLPPSLLPSLLLGVRAPPTSSRSRVQIAFSVGRSNQERAREKASLPFLPSFFLPPPPADPQAKSVSREERMKERTEGNE